MMQTMLDRALRLAQGFPPYVLLGASLLALLLAARLLWALLSRLGRDPYPYVAVTSLLTPAEQTFFVALRQAVGGECVLFAKVRLADLLQLERGATGKHRWKAFTSISSKHADFVLCDPRTFCVLGVVELDDSSHQQRNRRERDAFFNAAFAAASIPVWRVPVQRGYPLGPLREQAQAFLAAAKNSR